MNNLSKEHEGILYQIDENWIVKYNIKERGILNGSLPVNKDQIYILPLTHNRPVKFIFSYYCDVINSHDCAKLTKIYPNGIGANWHIEIKH